MVQGITCTDIMYKFHTCKCNTVSSIMLTRNADGLTHLLTDSLIFNIGFKPLYMQGKSAKFNVLRIFKRFFIISLLKFGMSVHIVPQTLLILVTLHPHPRHHNVDNVLQTNVLDLHFRNLYMLSVKIKSHLLLIFRLVIFTKIPRC